MSTEYKIFTKDELKFMLTVLEKHGCCNESFSKETVDECPFWSWDIKNENNQLGDCIKKHSEKFCVLLRTVLDNDDLVLTVRAREPSDIFYEKDEEKKKLLHNVRSVKSKINNLKITENALVKKMYKL